MRNSHHPLLAQAFQEQQENQANIPLQCRLLMNKPSLPEWFYVSRLAVFVNSLHEPQAHRSGDQQKPQDGRAIFPSSHVSRILDVGAISADRRQP